MPDRYIVWDKNKKVWDGMALSDAQAIAFALAEKATTSPASELTAKKMLELFDKPPEIEAKNEGVSSPKRKVRTDKGKPRKKPEPVKRSRAKFKPPFVVIYQQGDVRWERFADQEALDQALLIEAKRNESLEGVTVFSNVKERKPSVQNKVKWSQVEG